MALNSFLEYMFDGFSWSWMKDLTSSFVMIYFLWDASVPSVIFLNSVVITTSIIHGSVLVYGLDNNSINVIGDLGCILHFFYKSIFEGGLTEDMGFSDFDSNKLDCILLLHGNGIELIKKENK